MHSTYNYLYYTTIYEELQEMVVNAQGNFNHITEIIQRPRAVFRNSRENVGASIARPFECDKIVILFVTIKSCYIDIINP